jgi:hypothetical protein
VNSSFQLDAFIAGSSNLFLTEWGYLMLPQNSDDLLFLYVGDMIVELSGDASIWQFYDTVDSQISVN